MLYSLINFPTSSTIISSLKLSSNTSISYNFFLFLTMGNNQCIFFLNSSKSNIIALCSLLSYFLFILLTVPSSLYFEYSKRRSLKRLIIVLILFNIAGVLSVVTNSDKRSSSKSFVCCSTEYLLCSSFTSTICVIFSTFSLSKISSSADIISSSKSSIFSISS